MSKHLEKDLPELVKFGVIDEDTALKIEQFYEARSGSRTNKLLIVFGILGSLLIGLGTILIVAHNWDSFSKGVRLLFSALPLFTGQVVAFFLVSKRSESVAMREGTAAFIILSVGAVISLVSQIYNIHGDLGKFLLVWTALAIPVVYVLESSVASLLAWIGATSFVVTTGYNDRYSDGSIISSYWYLLLIALLIPYFIKLIRKEPDSNFIFFHHWVLVISLTLSLYALDNNPDRLLTLSYVGLFGVCLLVSRIIFFSKLRFLTNGWLMVGNLGTIYLLLSSSFEPWPQFYEGSIDGILIAIAILYIAGLIYLIKENGFRDLNPTIWCFPVFAVIYLIGTSSPELARVLINLELLALSVIIILDGARKSHLGLLNYGLLILSLLIISRFFDTQISFVLRGLLFILVGAGFFGFNYMIIRRNKAS